MLMQMAMPAPLNLGNEINRAESITYERVSRAAAPATLIRNAKIC
jgi:hypothetical protein